MSVRLPKETKSS